MGTPFTLPSYCDLQVTTYWVLHTMFIYGYTTHCSGLQLSSVVTQHIYTPIIHTSLALLAGFRTCAVFYYGYTPHWCCS